MSSSQISIVPFASPLGELILGSYEDKLCLCDWKYRKQREQIDARLKKYFNASFYNEPTEVTENTINQLEEYFSGRRQTFDLPLIMAGTEFQKTVWNKLVDIPFGQTQSYLQLSRNLGNEKAIRAVGTANGANAISIIIPCHRIIGSQGELIGYAGGIDTKKKLLRLEGSLENDQLALF